MPALQDALDALRGRFHRLRASRPYEEIAPEIQVSHTALKRFAHGIPVREVTLLLIEAWCLQQEQGTPHEHE